LWEYIVKQHAWALKNYKVLTPISYKCPQRVVSWVNLDKVKLGGDDL